MRWRDHSKYLVLAAGLAGCLLPSTAARAADLLAYSTSTAQQLPVAAPAGTVDWNGFYAGVFGASQSGTDTGTRFGLGIDAGVSTTVNFVLAGGEVAVTGLNGNGSDTVTLAGIGRAGVLLTDNLAAYGAAGYGVDLATGDGSALIGGGLEYALTDAVSLRAQYLRGIPVTGAEASNQITLGAQFHF